jgi:ribose-phosphate pyrophosphokinase
MNSKPDIVVVGSPSYGALAEEVAKAGNWTNVRVEWGQYPDGGGFHRVNYRDVQGRKVAIVGGTINAYERQSILSLATTLIPYRVEGLIICNPCMGTQRGDRWTEEGERAAAKLEMAQFSALPGVESIELLLFDLHQECVADFADMALRTAPCRYNKLTRQIVSELAGAEGRVASADIGGTGRVKRLSAETGILPVFAHKDRYSPTDVKVRVASDPALIAGRVVVLVDDILETGNTADAAGAAYRECGAIDVKGVFSHAPTTVEALKRLRDRGNLSEVHFTNSHPNAVKLGEALPEFVKVRTVGTIIKEAIVDPWDWLPKR